MKCPFYNTCDRHVTKEFHDKHCVKDWKETYCYMVEDGLK